MHKRTVTVTVKMSEQDLKNFEDSAGKIWPGAVLTKSGMMLGLARIGCRAINSVTDKASTTIDPPDNPSGERIL